MVKIIKKLAYYRDIRLLFRVFLTYIKLSLREGKALISFDDKDRKLPITRKTTDVKKIIKYVNFCLYGCKSLGIGTACLKRSMLLCYMLRLYGKDVAINFGVRKFAGKFIGHCWVKDIDEVNSYDVLFSYPKQDLTAV